LDRKSGMCPLASGYWFLPATSNKQTE